MRRVPSRLRSFTTLLLTACSAHTSPASAPVAMVLPDSTVALDAATGALISMPELLRRVAAADFVLLGELHDNPIHHEVRGLLLTASGKHPAVVFEQFPASTTAIQPPGADEDREGWLDRQGFDRTGWKWPLHAPVVDAAIAGASALWGSGLSREALRSVVKEGVGVAPGDLRALIAQSPLDSVAQAAIDQELIEGHCGKLPATMVPGMRAAQEVRDASMTHALLAAGATGPAWLIAGNGHVRMDMGVPRMLRNSAPAKGVLAVGLVERGTDGAVPGVATGQMYGVIIVTPPAVRDDPCAAL
jgi:uncharacterized iron-regulated protein